MLNLKLKYSEVLKRTASFKEISPKTYEKLLEQFQNMARGGDGGIFFLSYGQSTVRKQYYESWKNLEFTKLLEDLKNYEK